MPFDFTPENATEFLTLFSPFLPIIAQYLVARAEWSKEVKAGLAFALSALVAGITAYANGSLVENFWSNFFATFTAAQAIYWTFFKALGFENWVAPVEAVASQAAEQAKTQIATTVTPEQAKAVLNTADPTSVEVDAVVTV